MSAPPDPQDLLLAGSALHWAADGAAGAPLRDGDGAEQRQELGFGSAREHPPVTMATASPGVTGSSHLFDYGSTANGGDNSFYTSLISDVHYTTPRDSTYFTGIYQQENTPIPCSGSTEGFNALGHPVQDVTGFESRGLFSSDSGIEMTPAESTEVDKTLADPMKVEGYKYMDMSRSEEIKYQEKHDSDSEDESPVLSDKYRGTPVGSSHAAEPPRTPSESTKAAKEQDLLEDRKSGGQHSPSGGTTPVKITLTETESTKEAASKEPSPTQPDTGLKPSHEVVPTVTVSEPEDDSPGSVTPPSSGTEPSGSESQGKGSLSEDELISAIKEAKSFSFDAAEAQRAPAAEKREPRPKPGRPPSAPHGEHEASSAESGDSEIELVSEDPLAAEEVLHSNYMTFSHIGGPPPSPASPSIQYSILREEREAELDSELIIESCDASSASEESPKREQDSPLMKPKVMDIIKEENNSRADASEYEAGKMTESRMNRENLAESSSYLKSSFVAPKIGAEPPTSAVSTEELKERVKLKKPIEETVVNQSKVSSKDFGKKSPLASLLLPFLNKQKAIDLLYWRDIKQTGIVFGSLLLLLFSLTQFSVVSVVAYLALAGLSATISFRIYKSVLQAVQKTDEGHPFKAYLEMEMNLSQDQIQKYTDCLQLYVNSTVKELRRLFLVQDLVDSLKFAVLMWLLTYVGALFNGLTLLIMAVVSMFTLPVVYDKYQAQIDQYLGLVRTHINTVVAKIQAKIPGAKRKAE
ncbi:reticulon-1 isoform X1 [Ammospiza nelsoni]|uniref:reticulon-1 isoform X1 n=1 Tax=Ammospiza caudacuta TaxID=2857398 RepID=UPI002739BA51|nr:reticulon-1 isoform X1 [Ammospiza caudacuta]XP_059330755.1 reticulon-1 isoform X1 [Ammospiza nelsoni]